jgi:GT2 family glycosyltransferase
MISDMRTDPQDQAVKRPAREATDDGGGPSGISGSPVWDKSHNESARPSLRASVVVCAYTENRWPQIQAALASIARQTVPPWQVIVVADHNPALYQRLEAHYPDLEVIPNSFERGLSGARNSGVQQAGGDIVVFLDDDARAEPGWLETLLASYHDESVLGVGGLVLADWGSMTRPGWLPEEFLWVVGCSYQGLPSAKAEVRNPVGANMSFRRSAFDKVGLFDSSVGRSFAVSRPLGCEETEFSIRLLEAAPYGRIMYDPLAVVHHRMDRSRTTWRYFLHRCYAEGCSKARVARLSGMSLALSSERSYLRHTIRRAIGREIRAIPRPGGRDALGRLAALVLGVSWAAAGYAQATVVRTRSWPPRGRRPG